MSPKLRFSRISESTVNGHYCISFLFFGLNKFRCLMSLCHFGGLWLGPLYGQSRQQRIENWRKNRSIGVIETGQSDQNTSEGSKAQGLGCWKERDQVQQRDMRKLSIVDPKTHRSHMNQPESSEGFANLSWIVAHSFTSPLLTTLPASQLLHYGRYYSNDRSLHIPFFGVLRTTKLITPTKFWVSHGDFKAIWH